MYFRFGALFAMGALCAIPLWTRSTRLRAAESPAPGVPVIARTLPLASTALPVSSVKARRSADESKAHPNRHVAWRELDEDELMHTLSELSADDAELALQLSREASARFPHSSRAEERGYFEVRSLVNLGRMDEAVTRARALVAAYPHHPLVSEVARHLLTHPMTHPTEIGRQ